MVLSRTFAGLSLTFGSACVAACGEAPVEQPMTAIVPAELPAFTFKSFRVGTRLDEAQRGDMVTNCRPPEEDRVICDLADQRLGEIDLTDLHPSATFVRGRFEGLYIQFNVHRYGSALRSLRSAYGEPCHADIEWGSGSSWCFKEGRLELERTLPDNPNISRVSFFVNPPSAPERRFTPNSL